MPSARGWPSVLGLSKLKLRSSSAAPPEPKWICGKASAGASCKEGPDVRGRCQQAGPSGAQCKPARSARAKRDSLSRWTALAVLGLAILAVAYAADSTLLMPGPITTAHSSLNACTTCHSNIGQGRYGWLHGLVRFARPEKDSEACLSCHKAGTQTKNAMSPHGLSQDVLQSKTKTARRLGKTTSDFANLARIATTLFPVRTDPPHGGVFCATCHKEHAGKSADLKAMADKQCQACHVQKFESFSKDHPEFSKYPFKRRTRIAFDHAAHFGKHFPETREKRTDKAGIPDTCAACHSSSKDKRHMGLKPFGKTCATCHADEIVGKGRATGPQGIALLTLPGLDLEELKKRKADVGAWPVDSEAQVTPLMKLLLGGKPERYRLLSEIAELDLLDLNKASDAQISAVVRFAWEVKHLIHALTTGKASEIMKRVGANAGTRLDAALMGKLLAAMPRDVLISAQREWLPKLADELKGRGDPDWAPSLVTKAKQPVVSEPPSGPKAKDKVIASRKQPPPDRLVKNPKYGRWFVNVFGDLIQEGDKSAVAARRADDPTAGAKVPAALAAAPAARVASPSPSTTRKIDAESWTEFGGWYRKDFAILYKPTGHPDLFIKAWLNFLGHVYNRSAGNLAAQAFELFTHKDAQGQCTKCHSVDGLAGGGRAVRWQPSSIADKAQRFTRFVHEPHFRLLNDRGCLTCHEMSKSKDGKPTHKGLDPTVFVSNFKPVGKKTCASCHKQSAARQDCLLCHAYHVAPVRTPMMSTRLPGK